MTASTDHTRSLLALGIESSCDDTAAAIVCHRPGAPAEVRSSVVWGQGDLHAPFGGVVPEIAARAHAEKIDQAVEAALERAGVGLGDVDLIAATAGPGLIGGVLAGLMCAKGLVMATGRPLVGVNHLAGHALTPRLTHGLSFPYLVLLVSGGHCQFLLALGPERFRRLGGTIDDAPGEAFDKVARILGLPQPGGPAIEAEATGGDPTRFAMPRPLLDSGDLRLSFSGLKTAALRARDRLVAEHGGLPRAARRDLAASFQAAVRDVLAAKTARALEHAREIAPDLTALTVAGGVGANAAIRSTLESVAERAGVPFIAPPARLCTDNAAMIAWAGIERFRLGRRDGLDLAARPRWPLDRESAPLLGSGRKGAKA